MINSNSSYPGIINASAYMLRPKGVLPTLTFVLIISIGTAWSYDERYILNSEANVSRETLQQRNILSSDLAKQCQSLLNINMTQNNSAKIGNQRTVGQVAALGIILGARFALEPKNETADLHTIKADKLVMKGDDRKRTAHAIAKYRQCRKQLALNRTANKNKV